MTWLTSAASLNVYLFGASAQRPIQCQVDINHKAVAHLSLVSRSELLMSFSDTDGHETQRLLN